MKWPEYLILIRHAISAYNVLKDKKKNDPLYQEFCAEFDKDPFSSTTYNLALQIHEKYALGVSDANTPLIDKEANDAILVGKSLQGFYTLPDVIYVSPYERTLDTLEGLMMGWPALRNVKLYIDERVREREHGLSLLYNDWRVFHALNPDQRKLFKQEGKYYYRFPQGESIPDVRRRVHDWIGTLIREWSEQRVLAVTHHLTILSLLAELNRWNHNEFLDRDENDKPINTGVTIFQGFPDKGKNGKFEILRYNEKYY